MDGTVLLIIAALVVGLFVYFLPTLFANQRRHRERRPIFVLNLLAGWTFAGLVAALVWSLTSNTEPCNGG
jgi:H+/Cl- antiporter ClcA